MIPPLSTEEHQKTAVPAIDEDISTMIKAGVHIGHGASKTHPAMAPYMYTTRNGVAVFDLSATKERLEAAESYIKKIAAEKKTILFVGTKPTAKKLIARIGELYGYPTVSNRWIGGTLTNSKVMIGRINRLHDLLRQKTEGEFRKYTKKEAARLDDEIAHLEKTFGGLRTMKRLPDALFLADADENALAIREAKRLSIPTIAIVNSNTDPAAITYPIPANDQASPSLHFIFGRIENALLAGRAEKEETPSETYHTQDHQ